MPLNILTDYLGKEHIDYETIPHPNSFTAQETAASAHVPGFEFAKTVIVNIDGDLVMAVLPAPYKINLGLLKLETGAKHIKLATEEEFKDIFPGCEIGAMPPFGNLYGLDVYVEESLLEDSEIVFNAGSHTELMKISYYDYERLVKPNIGKFTKLH